MLTVLSLLILPIGVCPGIDLLSVGLCEIPAEGWAPLHLDGFEAGAFGLPGMAASRFVYAPPLTNNWAAWAMVADLDGAIVCSEADLSEMPVITEYQPAGGNGCQALTCVSGADTLWTCLLEDTDEFENGPVVAGSQESGYLVSSRPDCNGDWTRIARITPGGDVVFSTLLTSIYLLDLSEPVGEIGPSVASLGLTASGDVLVAGRVSQWFTSPEEWFVCLLDGETGEPVWKATGAGMGLAGLNQAVEAPSGALIGVGATSAPGDEQPWVWGPACPLIVVIGQDGTLIEEAAACPVPVDELTGIAFDGVPGVFLTAGRNTGTMSMILARVRITAAL